MDGFAIYSIGKSKFIGEQLSAKGLRLPSWDSDIMNLMHREYNDIQKQIKIEIKMKLKGNSRFSVTRDIYMFYISVSVTMDEYTSVCCRRYMNINTHCQNDVINLGLIRMRDSCGAEKNFQLLEKQLAHFGITNMQLFIVSIVSDGASLMKKLGKISQLDHQLCYAHGVHLAVCDVLYKNRSVIHIAGEDCDDDKNEEMYEEGFGIGTNSIKRSTIFQSRNRKCTEAGAESGKNISEKSREKRSLAEICVVGTKQGVLTCPRLQNSLEFRFTCSVYEMVKRLVCLKKWISKALLDLSIEHGIFTTEFSFLNELKCALEPIKLAVEAFCRKDTTLLTAEGVFQFLFVELEKRKSSLAEDLLCAAKKPCATKTTT